MLWCGNIDLLCVFLQIQPSSNHSVKSNSQNSWNSPQVKQTKNPGEVPRKNHIYSLYYSNFLPFSFTFNFWSTLLSLIPDCSHDKPVKQCNCNQYWHINNQYWHINNQYWHMNNSLIYFYTSILISFHYKIFKHGFMNYWKNDRPGDDGTLRSV